MPILPFLRVTATRLFPHPQCPRTCRTFCLPFNYSSLSPTPTLITFSSPYSDTPPLPLVPRTHCELWHCRCFKGLFSDSLNAWLTSTLSLGNSYRSGVDRGGQRCSLPCCKKPLTPNRKQSDSPGQDAAQGPDRNKTHKPKSHCSVGVIWQQSVAFHLCEECREDW